LLKPTHTPLELQKIHSLVPGTNPQLKEASSINLCGKALLSTHPTPLCLDVGGTAMQFSPADFS
jgi:hypothetical protein